jgi:hypothetical protein
MHPVHVALKGRAVQQPAAFPADGSMSRASARVATPGFAIRCDQPP